MSKAKWTDLDVVLKKMREIIEETGEFPSSKKLKEMGYGGLLAGIHKHHNGMNNIRKLLDYELTCNPYYYYKDLNNVIRHIEEAKLILGYEPRITDLEELFPGIKHGMRVYHGGYRKVKDLLGFKQLSAATGYWHNKVNVKKEVRRIMKENTGYFPSYNEIEEFGKRGLYTGILLCYGSMDECRKALNVPLNSKSMLEKRVKRILDTWVETRSYVDNLRKKLETEYGVIIIHPVTNNNLELDRYYYNEQIAIEVQGEQHFIEANLFADGKDKRQRLQETLNVDQSKKKQLEKQGITLIEISYKETDEEIIEKAKMYFKLLSTPRSVEVIKDNHEFFEDPIEAKKGLIELIKKYPDELFTSDFVKEKSPALYKALKMYHGGINGGRTLINMSFIRESRNSWTFDYTVDEFKKLMNQLGFFPTKEAVLISYPKLYYAIVKHGGLRKFKKLISHESFN